MAVFPLMQKIDDKTFLVVGNGEIAQRKIRLLRQFTDRILVITDLPSGNNLITDLPSGNDPKTGLTEPCTPDHMLLNRRFQPEDLEDVDFCIASTDDPDRNHRIAALCRDAKIPVNVPDDPDWCTFFLPAVIRRGDLVIAFSTDGRSPAFASYLRKTIESRLPEQTEQILDRMGELRTWVPGHLSGSSVRSRLYQSILSDLLSGAIPPEKEIVEKTALEWIRENIRP